MKHRALGVKVCTGAVATGGGFANFASGSGSSKTWDSVVSNSVPTWETSGFQGLGPFPTTLLDMSFWYGPQMHKAPSSTTPKVCRISSSCEVRSMTLRVRTFRLPSATCQQDRHVHRSRGSAHPLVQQTSVGWKNCKQGWPFVSWLQSTVKNMNKQNPWESTTTTDSFCKYTPHTGYRNEQFYINRQHNENSWNVLKCSEVQLQEWRTQTWNPWKLVLHDETNCSQKEMQSVTGILTSKFRKT